MSDADVRASADTKARVENNAMCAKKAENAMPVVHSTAVVLRTR